MRGLKALVIVMGLVIVVAASVLGTLIVERAGRLAADPGAPVRGALRLPAGARVLETRLEAGRIVLRAAVPGGEAVFVYDARSGAPIARYDIETGATQGAR